MKTQGGGRFTGSGLAEDRSRYKFGRLESGRFQSISCYSIFILLFNVIVIPLSLNSVDLLFESKN